MTDIDWEKRLKQRRAAVDRAERARDEDIAAAHASGMPWRKIGTLAGVNHERARQIGERIAKEHAPPPAE